MLGYIDTHTHITNDSLDIDEYLKDIKEAKDKGLVKSLLVLTQDSEDILYSKLKDDKYFSFAKGIFPTDADKYSDKDLDRLKELLLNEEFIALGEIGLDYYWAKDIADKQKELFIKQLKLADELDLPVIIHSRDAMKDTYDILKEYTPKRKGVLHCYSGSKEMALEFIKLGFYISFSGTITFKNNVHGLKTLEAIDKNYLLCETDAPYLAPVPYRGKRNKTAYVIEVYKFIADYLKMDLDDLVKQVYQNFERLFYKL